MKNIPRLLRREWLQFVLLVLPFAVAALWWNKLPDRVVSHWDIHNQPNGWMPKAPGLLLTPVLSIFLCVLIAFIPRIDPRLRRSDGNMSLGQRRAWRAFRLGLSALLAAISLMIIASAAGWHFDVGRVCFAGTFLLLAVVGTFLGRLKPHYLMGIRTPWTLEDPETWRATHRVGSRLMVFGSLTLLAVGFFVPATVQFGLLIGFSIVLILWSVGYSAWFYHTHTATAK